MNLWITGAFISTKCLIGLLLSRWGCIRIKRLDIWQNAAAGTLCGFVLFSLLPQAVPLCSLSVTIPAFILGIILAVFAEESRRKKQVDTILYAVHDFCLGWALLGGYLRLPLWLYFIPQGILLAHRSPTVLLWLPAALWAGTLTGRFCPVGGQVIGTLVSVSCGMLLTATHAHLAHTTHSGGWLGGIVSGLLLSII